MSPTPTVSETKQQATYAKLQRQLGFIAELRVKAVVVLCLIGVIFAIATTVVLLLLHDESTLANNLVVVEQERTLTQKVVSDSNVVIASGDQGYEHDLATSLKAWSAQHDLLLTRLGPSEQFLLHTADTNFTAMQQQSASLLQADPTQSSPTDVQMRFEMYSLQGQADIYVTALERISRQLQGYSRDDTLRIYQSTIVTGITLAIILTLIWLVIFQPAIERLHSNVLDITKTEHEVHEILVEAQRSVDDIEPLVTEVVPGMYTVQNGSNGVYFVHHVEGRGFRCSCPWYKRTGVCLHTRWAHAKHQELTASSGNDNSALPA